MTSPVPQPDEAWWANLPPEVESELAERLERALVDIHAGRLTSSDEVREETRAFFAKQNDQPTE